MPPQEPETAMYTLLEQTLSFLTNDEPICQKEIRTDELLIFSIFSLQNLA